MNVCNSSFRSEGNGTVLARAACIRYVRVDRRSIGGEGCTDTHEGLPRVPRKEITTLMDD